MRTKSAQLAALLANPSHQVRFRVNVADINEDLLDLDGDGPINPLLNVEINEDVDSHRTATVTLQRQQGLWSYAPLMLTSANPLLVFGDSRIAIGRRIQIFCGVVPADTDDWATFAGEDQLIFDGYIDRISWPHDEMQLTCTDFSARLRDTFIEEERVYGMCQGVNADRGAYVWRSESDAHVFQVGDLVVPSKMKANGHFYKVTAATSPQLVAEPTWPTGTGATVVSGGVTFTEAGATSAAGTAVETIIQQICADNGVSVALYTPVSPSWLITPYLQQRQTLLEAIEVFSQQIGWDLRYEYYAGMGGYVLTLKAPDRASTTSVLTIAEDAEWDCTELGQEIWAVRNAIRVVYGDATGRDPSGARTRIKVDVTDPGSIALYGRRFMEIAESNSSNIDSLAEAQTMANAALADLKNPDLAMNVILGVDPCIMLGDLITVPADGLRFDSDQKLAVQGINITGNNEGAKMRLTLRGKPVSQRLGWLAIDANKQDELAHRLTVADLLSPSNAIVSVVSGGRVLVGGDSYDNRNLVEQYEIHVSATPGFTPSSSTMKASGAGRKFDVVDLVPGKTYYSQIVPFTFNAQQKVRGSPSAEQSFVAGRTKAGHYDSASTQSHLPLNGNFEHATDDLTTAPPDHWQVVTRPSEATEVWGSAGSVYYGEDFTTKGRYVELRAHASKRGNIMSSPFEVRRGQRAVNLYLSIMRTGSSAAFGKDLILDIQGFADAAMANQIINYSITLSGDSAGPYPSLNTWYDVAIDVTNTTGALGSSVNFIRIGLRRGTTGDSSFAWRIGDVYLQEADFKNIRADSALITQPDWLVVGAGGFAPAFSSGWGNYGAGFQSAAFMKDSLGFVHVRGLVKKSSTATASAADPFFVLPSGYRPAARMGFTSVANQQITRVDIDTSGNVFADSPAAANWWNFVFLDGIHFDTR